MKAPVNQSPSCCHDFKRWLNLRISNSRTYLPHKCQDGFKVGVVDEGNDAAGDAEDQGQEEHVAHSGRMVCKEICHPGPLSLDAMLEASLSLFGVLPLPVQ